jgi:hypothetical protein
MEGEEDHRWTATACLIFDARYLALSGQTQFRKRGTAVGLRDVCRAAAISSAGSATVSVQCALTYPRRTTAVAPGSAASTNAA